MRTLECGCEVNADCKLLSVCVTHGEYTRNAVGASRHPRSTDNGLRDTLLAASMPTACERMARGDNVETVAQSVADLVYQIQRRLE